MHRALACAVVAFVLAGCSRDGREPGDDPTRSDEGPTAGRPATDPSENVQQPDASGVTQSDDVAGAPPDQRGSQDGPAEETVAPSNPR